ncbi:MAG: AAA family ATPase [Desulfobacterota bacterium]|nr:AAA family ATPase [Thermodesulfobacteriota bacterium]
MEWSERVTLLMKSLCSLFYLGASGQRIGVRKCAEIASNLGMDVYGYNIGEGLWRPGQEKSKNADIDPIEMLNRIIKSGREPLNGKRKLFLLEHFDALLENRDPFLLTKLRVLCDQSGNRYTTILFGRPGFRLPEILRDIPQVSVPTLAHHEIAELAEGCQEGLGLQEKKEIVESLKGLTGHECENLLSLCLAANKKLDVHFIKKERSLLISQRAQNLIQLCRPDEDLDWVGGLDILKEWLLKRGKLVRNEDSTSTLGLPKPKGVLLTGAPGCGKSFLAQALAGSWGVNLIRLDPPRLFAPLVGETEQNFIAAFETIRSLAPAVLWIDEFEKLFHSSSDQQGDGGVLSRVLAIVLDFLQSRRDGIFICATTNAIAGLPQEIMRAGRFDAVFFIDLPNRKEREHILKVLFRKYSLDRNFQVTEKLVSATESFSGAELDQAIRDLLYEQDNPNDPITEFSLFRTIKSMVPLARTMRENFEFMREWYGTRARFASSHDLTDQKGGGVCHISQR